MNAKDLLVLEDYRKNGFNFQPVMEEWDNVLNSIGWQTKK